MERYLLLSVLLLGGASAAQCQSLEQAARMESDRFATYQTNPLSSIGANDLPVPRLEGTALWSRGGSEAPENLSELPGGLIRGAALKNAGHYAYLKRRGVSIVVNLRTTPDDEGACRANGLECKQFPIRLFWPIARNIDWDMLTQAYRFVLASQRSGKVVYFHCSKGADRTGAMGAALMLRRDACGRPFDREAMWARVDEDLRRHQLAAKWFPDLYQDIKDLVYHFDRHKSWICEGLGRD